MTEDLAFLTIAALSERVRRRDLSPVELTRHCLDRIAAENDRLNAFVRVFEEDALRAARAAEHEIMKERPRGPLHGIPIGVKDNCDVAGHVTTGCSKAFRDSRAELDAGCVRKLREAGAVIIGKTNMHELAYGGTGEVSIFGPARNPWDLDRNAGGSSSGSGAAVAAGLVPAALGSDTGGSIRIPSSACGITGFKPTYGRVSRAGVLPLSWTLDHVGPLVRSVEDAVMVLNALSGPDPNDPTTLPATSPMHIGAASGGRLGAARFPEYELDPEVEHCFASALRILEGLGFEIEEFDLIHASEAHVAWLAIMYPEASSRYGTILNERYFDFSRGIRTQLEAGRHISGAAYLDAQRFRGFYIRQFQELTAKYDAIVMPTLPTIAPGVGQKEVVLPNRTISTQEAMTFTNLTANMLGWPAISVPSGFSRSGLPVGLTFIAPALHDERAASFALSYQNATDWHLRKPPERNSS